MISFPHLIQVILFLPKKGFPVAGKPLIESLSGLPFLGQDIEYHGSQQHEALDHPLVVRVQVDLEHAQVDHADQRCADHHAQDRSRTAAGGYAADNAGGNRVHLEVLARVRVGSCITGNDGHCGNRGQDGHVQVSKEHDPPGIYTGKTGRFDIAADHIEMTSDGGLACNECVSQHHSSHPHQDGGNAAGQGQLVHHQQDHRRAEHALGDIHADLVHFIALPEPRKPGLEDHQYHQGRSHNTHDHARYVHLPFRRLEQRSGEDVQEVLVILDRDRVGDGNAQDRRAQAAEGQVAGQCRNPRGNMHIGNDRAQTAAVDDQWK